MQRRRRRARPSAEAADAPAPSGGGIHPVACLLSTTYDRDTRARKVVESLASLGLRVVVIAWDREGTGPLRIDLPGRTILHLGPRSAPGSGMRQLPALLGFWARALGILLRGRFSVYHCNRFDTLLPALLARLVRRGPLVYDLHTSYADRLRIHERQPGMKAARTLVAAAERRVLRGAVDHAFTDSPAFTERLRAGGARSVSTVLNLPGIGFGVAYGEREARGGEVAFGRIGAFSAQLGQGADDLLEIMARNAAAARPLDLRLFLVGNFVPAGYRAEVEARAAALGGRVVMRDYVPHAEVPAWYARLDLTVVRYDVEGGARYSRLASAQKVFEAMAMGVPVILLANEYMEGVVRRTGCGVVPDDRSPEGVYRAFRRLAADAPLRARMGAAGRRAFLERYHWEREEREIHDAYRRVLRLAAPGGLEAPRRPDFSRSGRAPS